MAVYTPVDEAQAREFLKPFGLGELVALRGIEAGVSNTNYLVTTTQGKFILTLYEPHRVRPEDVSFFIAYARSLKEAGIPAPGTLPGEHGSLVSILCGRPATLMTFLDGEEQVPAILVAGKCLKAGAILAKMHLAVNGWSETRPNLFSLPRWRKWADEIGNRMAQISLELPEIIREEMKFIEGNWQNDLPAGAVHGDFFPDNLFFREGEVSGVIDFHFACTDSFAYDLAIALNAWSFDADNRFRPEWYRAMLESYKSIRPLSAEEQRALPLLLRAAALRFLLSRIEEKLAWKEGDFMIPHDPLVFLARLRHFQAGATP